MKNRKKMASILRKAVTVVFILAMVIGVAAVWRLALHKESPAENMESMEPESMEETGENEGVIYRFNENNDNAYVFIRNAGTEGESSDFADAFYVGGIDENDIYGEKGEHITEAELDTGDRVKVTVRGGVLETYPASYEEVLRIEVIKKADEKEKEACIQKYQAQMAELYDEPDSSEPPSAQLSYEAEEMSHCLFLTRGGYQWSWETDDGQMQTAVADTSFITEWMDIVEDDFSEADGELEIIPGKDGADAVAVSCWPKERKGVENVLEGESVQVENRDGKWYFTGVKPGCYYLIRVSWGDDYVEYGFLSK